MKLTSHRYSKWCRSWTLRYRQEVVNKGSIARLQYRHRARFEFSIPFNSPRILGFKIKAKVEEDNDILCTLNLGWLGNYYFSHSVPQRWLERWIPRTPHTALGVNPDGYLANHTVVELTAMHGLIWWHLWLKDTYDFSGKPWYRDFTIDWMALLFGRVEVKSGGSTLGFKFPVKIGEESYTARVRASLESRGRRRLPWSEKYTLYDFNFGSSGPPIPGNSWDCEDKTIRSMSVKADCLEEAVSILEGRVIERQSRYGGLKKEPECEN